MYIHAIANSVMLATFTTQLL